MFLNLQTNKYEIFVLVGVLSGFGTKLLLQPFSFCGCTLMRGTFKNKRPSDKLQSAQALAHARGEAGEDHGVKAYRAHQYAVSVEIKYERPKTQGQECESSGDVLEHSDNAVDFIEVVGEHVVVAGLVSDLGKCG